MASPLQPVVAITVRHYLSRFDTKSDTRSDTRSISMASFPVASRSDTISVDPTPDLIYWFDSRIFRLVVGSSTMVLVGGRSGQIYGLGFEQCEVMASADAELERLLKEIGKQLSLPHDYVDELLHVLDGCSTRNKAVGLEFALTVKYAFPRSHFRFKIFLLTMSAKVHPGYRLAISIEKPALRIMF
ncbi:hypothetical protein HanIR_Chr14g0674781 [Helianthus annuus]|nr:hypothetical protein HanIR_Chr14g0674781 [Helianthus annuus]